MLANFQGPFSLHPVMARALKVPGNRLRLRTPPDSGGSFGVKQAIFPYIVLIAAAARVAGRPVKWIEDRLEHLCASVSATNRVTTLEAAVDRDGRITALAWDQLEDCGAHLRAPEPATLYRMHGNLTGAYDIRHVKVRNRIVLTNKTPTGLNRGFGGPQMYYPLERLMQRIAIELKLDPLEVIRRNLVPATAHCHTGRRPGRCWIQAISLPRSRRPSRDGGSRLAARRDAARAEGRHYGIGFAAVVEPSVSNMGYITTALTPEERRRAGPKNGAQSTATISLDPLGAVSVQVASTPQGQGHRTVLAQVVADALGLKPQEIRVVADMDTAKDAWSIASGNYSSRFAPAVAGAAQIAALRLRDRLARLAGSATQRIAGGDRVRRRPRRRARKSGQRHFLRARRRGRALGARHDSRRTRSDDPRDRVLDAARAHGADRGRRGQQLAVPRLHLRFLRRRDRSRLPAPCASTAMSRCTIAAASCIRRWWRGRSAAALPRRSARPCTRNMSTPRTAAFCPARSPIICCRPRWRCRSRSSCISESPSPFTPLGAKGVGEGNCMSTPVCIANAIADALGLDALDLPATPAKLAAHLHGPEPPRAASRRGREEAVKPAPFDYVRAESLDEALDVLPTKVRTPRVLAGGQTLVPMLNMRMARLKRRRSTSCGCRNLIASRALAARSASAPPFARPNARACAGSRFAPAASRRGAAVDRPCADAQPRHRLRLGRACRSERRAAAGVCIALDGEIELRSQQRQRRVPAESFFTGMMTTDLRRRRNDRGRAFPDRARRHRLRIPRDRAGGMAISPSSPAPQWSMPRRLGSRSAASPTGRGRATCRSPGDPALDDALDTFAWDLDARDDLHATADYRRQLVRALGRQTLEEAARCRA